MGPLQCAPCPPPTAFSQDPPRIRSRERTSLVKNRMREICTSGSVRGEGGNILTYSALRDGGIVWGAVAGEGDPGVRNPRRQLTGARSAGGRVGDIGVVEDKRQVHRVVRLDAGAMGR